jgi:serine protease Do
MAKYRIVRAQPPPEEEQQTEYWQVKPSAKNLSDLDMDEIYELNQQPVEDEPEVIPPPKGKGILGVVITIILAASFLLLSFSGIINLSKLPDLGFLRESAQLSTDPLVESLKESVVSISSVDSQGTGFNIDAQGLIVTNNHVVEGKKVLTIKFPDGSTYMSKSWQTLPAVDLAVIEIRGQDLPYLHLANQKLKDSDKVIFIGNPLGFDWTVGEGTVLQEEVLLEGWSTPVILLKGTIYPGSSGSPVFNTKGEVAAVIFATVEGQENTGLAVPISDLAELFN